MSVTVQYIMAGIAGYLLGSINSALVVGKILGIDIREHGSKNAGTTNAVRVFGKKKAICVLAGDILKGIIACLCAYILSSGTKNIVLFAGLLSVIGHNWPVYFGFKGGKGALTSITVIFFADYRLGLVLTAIFIIIVYFTHYVSLGSMVGAVCLPIFSLILNNGPEFFVISVILCLLLIYRHRENIKRLLKGEESEFGFSKYKK